MIKRLFSLKLPGMGYVFDFQDALHYEHLMSRSENRLAVAREARLLLDMLNPMDGNTVLDIGCGTGMNLRTLLDEGLQVTGLDASPYMMDIVERKFGNRVDLHRGMAEDLPFDDNTFNYACMTNTLEFVENPLRVIEEACRVTRDKLYVGILNRYAINGIQLRVKGVFTETIYNRARFFSIWELKKMVRSLMGDVPISWRTTCQLPTMFGEMAHKIEQINAVQRCPFGSFVGMVITLVPRFRTKPLSLRYRPKHTTGEATG